MRMLRLLHLLSFLLAAGCCKGMPKHRSLGTLDLSAANASFNAEFVCPDRLTGLLLVVHDGKGAAREYCSSPSWPLTLSIEIVQPSGNQSVLAATVDKDTLQFTTWHNPSTSVLLNLTPPLAGTLEPGQTYSIRITVNEPYEDLGEAEVFLHWLGG